MRGHAQSVFLDRSPAELEQLERMLAGLAGFDELLPTKHKGTRYEDRAE